jgi:hypothetical protein
MHEVETVVVNGASHAVDSGPNLAPETGAPADRKRIREMLESEGKRPMGMFLEFGGRLSLQVIRDNVINKMQKQRPKTLQGMSEAELLHHYMTKFSPGGVQGGRMIWYEPPPIHKMV